MRKKGGTEKIIRKKGDTEKIIRNKGRRRNEDKQKRDIIEKRLLD